MTKHFRLLYLPCDRWDNPPIVLHETKDTSFEEYIVMIDKLPFGCKRKTIRNDEYFIEEGINGLDFYKVETVGEDL